MYVFELPEIGEGVVEGEIVRWLVNAGESVAVDQPMCEIMTDKATVEISSPKSGRVAKLHGKPGDIIKVHSALVEIDLGGGASAPVAKVAPVVPAVAAPAAAAVATAQASQTTNASVSPVQSPAQGQIHPAVAAKMPPPPRAAGEKALASPAVRSEAKSRGIDIDEVPGSGKGGRVTRDDLSGHPEPKALPGVVASGAARFDANAPARTDERIPIIGLRRKIAQKMTEAWRLAPHFTYVDEVDASQLVELRNRMKGYAETRGVKLSYLPFIFKALATTFRDFPTLNAVMDEEKFELIVRGDVNIGIATDTPAGLYVPVVKRVQDKSLLEIAQDIADVTQRTRENRASKDDLTGSTFTVTSVGNIGGRFATPILNHPEVAILGVNQIHDRPMAINGQVVIRPMMYLSPSFDHRVIDGAVAARFVSALKALLENPQALFLELR